MINDELLYKLWLNIQCGHDPQLIDKCIKKYGSAEKIYNYKASPKEMMQGIRLVFLCQAAR